MSQNKVDILERALERQKNARKEAEKILENKSLELYNTSIYHYCLMQHKKPVFLCIHLFQESSQKKPHTDFIMRHSTITLHVFSNPVDHYSGLCVINYQPMI